MARICFSQRGRGVLTEWSSFSGGVRSWSLFDDRLHKYLIPNPFIFLPFNADPRICLSQQVCLPTNRGEIIELISGLSDERTMRCPSSWFVFSKGFHPLTWIYRHIPPSLAHRRRGRRPKDTAKEWRRFFLNCIWQCTLRPVSYWLLVLSHITWRLFDRVAYGSRWVKHQDWWLENVHVLIWLFGVLVDAFP